MKQRVELPLGTPMFCTYGFQILSTALCEIHPHLKNWAMNSLVFLRCNPDFLTGLSTSPEVFVSRSGYQDCPYFDITEISLRFVGTHCNSVIRSLLDDGQYVYYSDVDDSLIRKKYPRHGRLFSRSGVICGYDVGQSAFRILTCGEDGGCETVWVPQRWIELGRKKSEQNGFYGMLRGIKVRPVSVDLNLKEIRRNLKTYTEYGDRPDGSYRETSKAYGPAVYRYVAMYLNYLRENVIPRKNCDGAVFRQIAEHQRCMLRRLRIAEDAMKSDHTLSDRYEGVVLQTDEICRRYGAFCKTQTGDLADLRDETVRIGREEESILRQFVVNMEEVIGP